MIKKIVFGLMVFGILATDCLTNTGIVMGKTTASKPVAINFSKPNSGFDETAPFQSKDGKLWFLQGKEGYFHRSMYQKKIAANFTVSVKACWTGGKEDSDFGLVFRYIDSSDYYTFSIDHSGNFMIYRKNGDDWQQHGSKQQKSSQVSSGVNLLAVTCRGNLYQCFINGMMVAEFRGEFPGNKLNYVGLGASAGLDCSFDDFTYQELTDVSPEMLTEPSGPDVYVQTFDFTKKGSGFVESDPWELRKEWMQFSGIDDDYYHSNTFYEDLPADCLISVKVQWVSGIENGGYGLAFRRIGSDFYSFHITANGYFNLQRMTGNGWEEVKKWRSSDLIRTDSNLLAVSCLGPEIKCYINRYLVIAIDDAPALTKAKIGFGANSGVSCRFTDLKIYPLSKTNSSQTVAVNQPVPTKQPASFDPNQMIAIPNDDNCNEGFIAQMEKALIQNGLTQDFAALDAKALRNNWQSIKGKAVFITGTTLFIGTKQELFSGNYMVIGMNRVPRKPATSTKAIMSVLDAIGDNEFPRENFQYSTLVYTAVYKGGNLVDLHLSDGSVIKFKKAPGDYTFSNGAYSAIYRKGVLQNGYLEFVPWVSSRNIVLEYGSNRTLTAACWQRLRSGGSWESPLLLSDSQRRIVGFQLINKYGEKIYFDLCGYRTLLPDPFTRAVESRRAYYEKETRVIKVANFKMKPSAKDLFPETISDYPAYIPIELEHNITYHSILNRAVDGMLTSTDLKSDVFGNIIDREEKKIVGDE